MIAGKDFDLQAEQPEAFVDAVSEAGVVRHNEAGVRLEVCDLRVQNGVLAFCDTTADSYHRLAPSGMGGDNGSLPDPDDLNLTCAPGVDLPTDHHYVDRAVVEVSCNGRWNVRVVEAHLGGRCAGTVFEPATQV